MKQLPSEEVLQRGLLEVMMAYTGEHFQGHKVQDGIMYIYLRGGGYIDFTVPQIHTGQRHLACIDCRHVIHGWRKAEYNCALGRLDPVTGEHKEASCHSNRKADGICGPEGRLWEEDS